MAHLEHIGYSEWFEQRVDDRLRAQHEIARVIAVHKESYMVSKGEAEIFAELSGNLMYTADSTLDLPTVGDWVYADFFDEDSHGIIYGVLPRRTLLKRKTPGKQVDFQLVAANIDVAFIIQSLNENFNLRRLERYLVMVNETGIQPIILLSKADLMSERDIADTEVAVRDIAPQATVLGFSNLNRDSVERVIALLQPGLSYCLLGSSGVGKTSLLNSIMGSETFETRAVSAIQSKGRHTTTSRQLVSLSNGAMIIDTPGMRELGGMAIDEGLEETFAEITELASQCKFSNCSHSNEKGCAILAAIASGELSEQRYQNYLKMKRESEFNDMSYSEKRDKDKRFGKMVKSVIKSKQR
jgi:ribosome biogenesis GTPase / thiamine phosphate phosphatase